ncbi:MAG TPA: helix-turn-helix domain-containing protein [Segeticoccus sp.]|nr:helix-turn-helix domain-containing protein [Segeticoccus sp.]
MTRVPGLEFLELLARDAAPIEFEGPLVAARASGADADALHELQRAKVLALQVREVLEGRRRREAELSALFETASDLAALNDVDDMLRAIVHRARLLLHSDVAYLSLNDEEHGDTYMRVTEGIIAPSFKAVRLPMGAGLGGLVAQTATPYASADYFRDERFDHTDTIDGAVADEGLNAILGVPLLLGKQVIGVLYAANRERQPFGQEAVALLVSLAAHAAIAIDNTRLLAETQLALNQLESASGLLRQRTASVERAADAHDRLTRIVLRGGGVDDVVHEVRAVLGGEVVVTDPSGAVIASTDEATRPSDEELSAARRALGRSRSADGPGFFATPVVAGDDQFGALLLRRAAHLDQADRQILERSALVTALLLLFRRGVAEAEARVRGELLEDLLTGTDRDPAGLRERARILGADLDRPHAVVATELVGDRTRTAQAAAYLAGTRGGFAAPHDGRLVAILPGLSPREAATVLLDGLRPLGNRRLTAGAAGPASGGPAAILAAHDQAAQCLDAMLALGRTGEVATSDDLGFVGLLLGAGKDVGAFVRAAIGPVLDYDTKRRTKLVGTLEAYFRHGGNLSRTATDLHVHVNTVTQRLERVSRLLGEQWQEPERELEVQLALRLHRLVR